MGQALPPIPTQSTLPPPPLQLLLKRPGKGLLSHLAYIFREMAPSPIPSQREVSSTPGFLPSGHYPPLPEAPLSSFPPLSILSLDQAPPRLLLPIQPVPNRKALSLGSHRSPLTLPSSKRKQTEPALPPGVHCIPTARLVLASGVGVGDLPGVPKQPLGNKASSESPQPSPPQVHWQHRKHSRALNAHVQE